MGFFKRWAARLCSPKQLPAENQVRKKKKMADSARGQIKPSYNEARMSEGALRASKVSGSSVHLSIRLFRTAGTDRMLAEGKITHPHQHGEWGI